MKRFLVALLIAQPIFGLSRIELLRMVVQQLQPLRLVSGSATIYHRPYDFFLTNQLFGWKLLQVAHYTPDQHSDIYIFAQHPLLVGLTTPHVHKEVWPLITEDLCVVDESQKLLSVGSRQTVLSHHWQEFKEPTTELLERKRAASIAYRIEEAELDMLAKEIELAQRK